MSTANQNIVREWAKLREDVKKGGFILTPEVFERIRGLFIHAYAQSEHSPKALTSEYHKDEYLLVVGAEGQPTGLEAELLPVLRRTYADHPEFARWFKLDRLREGDEVGELVILCARWLSHLIGLRHGTVEVFIDPPDRKGFTFVQVRGTDKFEAPGAFDIPCAGHISGTDSVQESLSKELGEELNLTVEDLTGLRLVSRYNSYAKRNRTRNSLTINNEYRVLYRAKINLEALEKIRFTDGEVAGLALMSVGEVRELVRRFPERVASGLSDAMEYYL